MAGWWWGSGCGWGWKISESPLPFPIVLLVPDCLPVSPCLVLDAGDRACCSCKGTGMPCATHSSLAGRRKILLRIKVSLDTRDFTQHIGDRFAEIHMFCTDESASVFLYPSASNGFVSKV